MPCRLVDADQQRVVGGTDDGPVQAGVALDVLLVGEAVVIHARDDAPELVRLNGSNPASSPSRSRALEGATNLKEFRNGALPEEEEARTTV